jgi:AcrR family transcriptional regulator
MKQFKIPKLEKKRAVRDDLKDLRRESILDAAEFLLAKQSIENISMMDVAKTIKLAKGTLYIYFKTK